MTDVALEFRRNLLLGPRQYFVVTMLGVAKAAGIAGVVALTLNVFEALPSAATAPWLVFAWVGALAAVMLFNAGVRYIEFTVTENIGFEVVRRLRMAIYGHMAGMAPRQIQHRSRGSLILRLTGDLTMLRTWISRGIARAVVGGVVAIACIAILAWLSLPLMTAALSVVAAGVIASLAMGPLLARATRRVRRIRGLMTSNIDEQVNTLSVVQLFGRTRGEHARLSRQNDALTRALIYEAGVRGRLRAVSAGAGWLAAAAVLGVGAWELGEDAVNLGTIVAAVTAVRFLNSATQAIAFAHEYWRRAQVSRRKILDFFDSSGRELDAPEQSALSVRTREIEFVRASVEGALHELTVRVPAGARVAIMGPTGAGKSTVLNLIARLVEPTYGEVRIDGAPLNSVTAISTFKAVGMVSSDLPLMRGTVRRNLTYRKAAASDEEIARLSHICALDEVLSTLPDGLDTWITEGGGNLSLGQRQRLALARALMGNPPILLLDEATAALDYESRRLVWDVISRHDGTVMMITHDPQEAELADQVWLMRAGRLERILSGDEWREQCRLARISRRRDLAASAVHPSI